jgi:hypothetical protein
VIEDQLHVFAFVRHIYKKEKKRKEKKRKVSSPLQFYHFMHAYQQIYAS